MDISATALFESFFLTRRAKNQDFVSKSVYRVLQYRLLHDNFDRDNKLFVPCFFYNAL